MVLAFTILLTCGYMGAVSQGFIAVADGVGYENRLFDASYVHTIDIVMNDWDSFIASAQSEEYSSCTVVIDGEKYSNVAIRAKGNTSLSSVAEYGNNRYSFKIEFDHYQNGKTYYGLDKLCLNNLIQDKTYMKDYFAYTLMSRMGVSSPLCSFVQINVNGSTWGLYLAVEGIEDGFITRNYGGSAGEIYKPDSLSFGGGRGNGADFDMDEFSQNFGFGGDTDDASASAASLTPPDMGNMTPPGSMPSFGGGSTDTSAQPQTDSSDMDIGAGDSDSALSYGDISFTMPSMPDMSAFGGSFDGNHGEDIGGMGSDDVKLQYIDDDPDSYSNIFDNAKTDITDEDKTRLIASLKTLSEGEDIESAVDVDKVIRYFVVHNFLCNDDSYTGTMVHNYYLYENDGVMAMIPWDYNLAFGGFSFGMGASSSATSTVNSPIDTPVSSGDISSRPMIAWIFQSDEYIEQYHEIYSEFISETFGSGWFDDEIDRVTNMIAPYVEQDINGFFTYDEFTTGAAALKQFCTLRAQSISGQLDGTIPSTASGQQADSSALIDASAISLEDMGEFSGGDMPSFSDMPSFVNGDTHTRPDADSQDTAAAADDTTAAQSDTDATAGDNATAQMVGMPSTPDGADASAMGTPPSIPGSRSESFDSADANASDTGSAETVVQPSPATGAATKTPESTQAPDESDRSNADSQTAPASDNASASSDADSAQNSADEPEGDAMGGARDRPDDRGDSSGDFSSGSAVDSTYQYILLGGSVLLLIAGLVFAKLFKGKM